MVSLGDDRSFVIADIPGVIEGAAEGAGLGIQFLKHLERTRLLLHIIDIGQWDSDQIASEASQIIHEVEKFGGDLAGRERWLVLNKIDLLQEDDRRERRETLLADLDWEGPVFEISAVTGEGTKELLQALMQRIEELRAVESDESVGDDEPWDPLQ